MASPPDKDTDAADLMSIYILILSESRGHSYILLGTGCGGGLNAVRLKDEEG